jgi:hypothetical protein
MMYDALPKVTWGFLSDAFLLSCSLLQTIQTVSMTLKNHERNYAIKTASASPEPVPIFHAAR